MIRKFGGADASVAVIHVIWRPFGIEVFKKFVDSYAANPGGAQHNLVLVFKGFSNKLEMAEFRDVAAGHSYRAICVEDGGFDIGSYLMAAKKYPHEYYCFRYPLFP